VPVGLLRIQQEFGALRVPLVLAESLGAVYHPHAFNAVEVVVEPRELSTSRDVLLRTGVIQRVLGHGEVLAEPGDGRKDARVFLPVELLVVHRDDQAAHRGARHRSVTRALALGVSRGPGGIAVSAVRILRLCEMPLCVLPGFHGDVYASLVTRPEPQEGELRVGVVAVFGAARAALDGDLLAGPHGHRVPAGTRSAAPGTRRDVAATRRVLGKRDRLAVFPLPVEALVVHEKLRAVHEFPLIPDRVDSLEKHRREGDVVGLLERFLEDALHPGDKRRIVLRDSGVKKGVHDQFDGVRQACLRLKSLGGAAQEVLRAVVDGVVNTLLVHGRIRRTSGMLGVCGADQQG
jgi:hypothetical protein